MQHNPSLSWGGRYKDIDDVEYKLIDSNGKLHTSGNYAINLSSIILNETNFRLFIRAHVLDIKRCHGKDGNFTYIGE